ncbi:MAG: hypothetical protein M3167_00830 [Acidobacteriota bacterium]|nr:hypothetical protein [Acidobacteriota bacterium]
MIAAAARGRISLGSIAIAAVASFAGASEGFRSPQRGALLQPGERVEVSWTLPTDFRAVEMELILSLDGGKSFPIRVTRDLPPSTTTVRWRVPAFATPRARLGLRTGDDEEPDREIILFLSEEFAIVPDPSAGSEPVVREQGEWRTAEAGDSADSLPLPISLEPGSPTPTLYRTRTPSEGAPPRVPLISRPLPRFDTDRSGTSAPARASRMRTVSAGSGTPLRL